MTVRPREQCPDDAGLIAFLDDAMDVEERLRVEGHLRTCATCDERVRRLRARSEAVTAWLQRHDTSPPPRSAYDLRPRRRASSVRGWAVAASVVLAAAVAAGPARGWLLSRLGLRAPETPTVSSPAPVSRDATSFRPTGPEISIVFTMEAGPRRLLFTRTDDSLVTVRAPGPEAELLLRPGSVEIRDPSPVRRDFGVSLPPFVQRVRVRMASASDTLIELPDAGGATTVDLPGG